MNCLETSKPMKISYNLLKPKIYHNKIQEDDIAEIARDLPALKGLSRGPDIVPALNGRSRGPDIVSHIFIDIQSKLNKRAGESSTHI